MDFPTERAASLTPVTFAVDFDHSVSTTTTLLRTVPSFLIKEGARRTTPNPLAAAAVLQSNCFESASRARLRNLEPRLAWFE